MSRGTWVEARLEFGDAVWASVAQASTDNKLTVMQHARNFMVGISFGDVTKTWSELCSVAALSLCK
jgi:hypothetical protein